MDRKKQIKYYTELLKDDELLLLKSSDCYFKNHYLGSPLNIVTNFQGSAGEAIINKKGTVQIFVDPRYHILVELQVYSDVVIHKLDLGETFFDRIKKIYPKNTIMHVVNDIPFSEYIKLDKHFDLRTYKLPDKYLKNYDYNPKAPIFSIDKNIDNTSFVAKVNKLRDTNKNIEKMLIFNLDQIAYLTGLRSFQVSYSSLLKSILYLDFKNLNYTLFLDKIPKKIFIEQLQFKQLAQFSNFIQSIDDNIYIEHDDVSLEQFLSIKKPVEVKKKNLALLSSIKPLGVIQDMSDASNKLDNAIKSFKKRLKKGLSEHDLVEIFNHELVKSGLNYPSFKTILALGENSASIHYSSYDKNKILRDETLLLLDCGGYSSSGHATDITRTLYFGSNPDPFYKKAYTYVLKAFINCYLSKEANAKSLDFLARKILEPMEKYNFYFNHGLGHGIGTSCHQNPPVLSINSKDLIMPYQVHSIEPGLYGEYNGLKFGVRIENCVYFDLNYNRYSMSHFPFEDILIDYSMLSAIEKEFVENWK